MRTVASILIACGLLLALMGTLAVPEPHPRGLAVNQRYRAAEHLREVHGGRALPGPSQRRLFHDRDLSATEHAVALPQAPAPLPTMARPGRGAVDVAGAAGRSGPWSLDRLLADPTQMNDQHLSVAVNPATGNLFAAFESRDLGGTDRDIHLAWSTDGGETWDQRELHPSSLDEYQPDLAIDAAGYLHVVWARDDGALVRARSAGPEDVQNWALVRVFEVGEPVALPSITVSGSGDYARVFIACCWYTINWDWYQYEYTLLWLYSTNGSQTVAYDYLYPDGYQDFWPDTASDGATVYLINGEQDPYTGRIRILAAADALSGSFADYIDLCQTTEMSSGFPSLAADGDKVHIAWQLDWDDGLGNLDGDIMYAFSWDGLASVYGPYEIQATPTESVGPAVATAGGSVVCWWLEASTGGDEFELAARSAGLDGHPDGWGRVEYVTDQPMVVPQFRAATGCVTQEALVATWIDRRDFVSGGYNVYTSDRPLVADLAPHAPDGWSSPLILNLLPGERQDSDLAAGVPTYVSFAVANLGLADATGPVAMDLLLDDVVLASWEAAEGLPSGAAVAVEDWPLVLDEGAHTLSLVVDPADAVVEADEQDNRVDRDCWVPSGYPTLEPEPSGLTIQVEEPPVAPLVQGPPRLTARLDPRLAAAMQRGGSADRWRVVVVPSSRPTTSSLAGLGRSRAREVLRSEVARFSSAVAARSASPLRSLWLSGELVGNLTADEIQALLASAAVGGVWLDDRRSTFGATEPVASVNMTDLTTAQRHQWYLDALGVPEAWIQGVDGTGVLVGHTDSGVAWDHPELVGHLWDGGAEYPHHGYDFLDEDNDPYDPGDGGFWHGTHTAGLVVSTSFGAAPGARLLVTRCVPGYYEDMVQALQFCVDQDCAIISTSAGWTGAGDALRSANRVNAEILEALGVVWVVAAGNGDNMGGHLDPPLDISSPGDCPHPSYGAAGHSAVITVGALTSSGSVWSGSSRGPTAWGVAGDAGHDDYPYPPGLAKPDLAAPGAEIISTVGGGGTAIYSGTSMATPLVAGCTALLLQRNPTLTPAELGAALEASCADIGAAGRDLDSGAGLVDVPATLAALPTGQVRFVQLHNRGTAPRVLDTVTSSVTWLTATPSSGLVAVGDSLRLGVAWDAAGLPAGGHQGVLSLDGNQAGGPVQLPVVLVVGGATGVEEAPPLATGRVAVIPNPFNPQTSVRFTLPSSGPTELVVFDARGRRVRTLVDAELAAGDHEAVWDGKDGAGRGCAAGVYLLRLRSRGQIQTGRAVLVR